MRGVLACSRACVALGVMPRPPTHPLPDIIAAIRAARGNLAEAARALGMTRQALAQLVGRHRDLAATTTQARRGRRERCPTCRGRGTVPY